MCGSPSNQTTDTAFLLTPLSLVPPQIGDAFNKVDVAAKRIANVSHWRAPVLHLPQLHTGRLPTKHVKPGLPSGALGCPPACAALPYPCVCWH